MKQIRLHSFAVVILMAVTLAVSCSEDKDTDSGAVAGDGDSMPVTAALLDALPPFNGATLVREWLAEAGRIHVREYAVSLTVESGANAVTGHFRAALLDDGWQESEARAAISSFTKDGRRIVIGRVGPQLMEPPTDATLLFSAQPPAGSGFFYTLEAED